MGAFLLNLAATGPTSGFCVGAVASFFDSMLTDRLGMGLSPTVGAQFSQISLATEQAAEHVFHVQPQVQMVAMSRADDRKQDRRSVTCFHTSYE